MKKIAIVGPESTGKSELAQQLARDFDCEWVPEYARFYLDRLMRNYEQSDLLQMARGQIAWEDDKAQYNNDWIFCDTNLIVIKIWSDFKYGTTDSWIEENLTSRKYDFYLLTDIDLPWRHDPQREHPTRRKELFDLYHDYLLKNHLPFAIVRGIEEDRLTCAKKALAHL